MRAQGGAPTGTLMLLPRRSALLLPFAVLLTIAGTPAHAQERIKVVASFSILADFVRQVGGDRVEVVSLVGPDGDAHVFSPSPAHVKQIADAKLVIMNGLEFEGWMDRLVKVSGAKAPLVIASKGLKPIKAQSDRERDHDPKHTAHKHGSFDPHAWHNAANAKLYVTNICDRLIATNPAGREAFEANAKSYLAQLDRLESEVKATLARIPADRRKVVTTHAAFGYFATAYGVVFIAPQGISTEAEPSAKDVAKIVRQIRREKVRAVFLENVSDPRLAEQIARDSGAKVGDRLFSDALSEPGGPAGTYIDMIRHNLRALSDALAS